MKVAADGQARAGDRLVARMSDTAREDGPRGVTGVRGAQHRPAAARCCTPTTMGDNSTSVEKESNHRTL